MLNFWRNLTKPIYALAPMAGIADSAFRIVCKNFGADVVYSEMASAAALVYSPAKTLEILKFDEGERPYVVQLFGSEPKHFKIAAGLVAKKIQPDGIDINFGCPVKKVIKQGAGAILMNDLDRSREIIRSVIENVDLPVSIKTRTSAGGPSALEFLDNVNDLDIAALMIHGRTLKQGFSGPIDSAIIKKARDHFGGVILANGGVMDKEDAERILAETGADGVGIARGTLGKPWIFEEVRSKKLEVRSKENIAKLALRHAELSFKLKGGQGIIEMRKHLSWYVQGMAGAKRLRMRLVKANSLKDIEKIFQEEIKNS